MTKYRYIRPRAVRELVNKKGKRCSAGFLSELDIAVEELIRKSLRQWNGNRKTLDRTVVQVSTGKLK